MTQILFIHGMYMTGGSWHRWEDWFRGHGYGTQAPSWPGRDAEPAALRANPPEILSTLTLQDVVDQYADLIRDMDEPPVLVGHSMGGLVVQLLLQRGLGARGVAIDSAPPQGLNSFKWSFLKSNAPVLWPGSAPLRPTPASWKYAFAHTLSDAEAHDAFETYVVPESRLVGKGAATATAKVDFAKDRPPLLLIAGEEDHIIPASLNRKNYDRYSASPAVTEFREFPGRTHWICGMEGWEEVAGAVKDWIASA